MDVIPLMFTEADFMLIPTFYLDSLSQCAKPVILEKLQEYIASSNAKDAVIRRINSSFGWRFEEDAYLKDPALAQCAKEILELKYSDISSSTDRSMLEYYQRIITDILTSEYSKPYIAPIKGSEITAILTELKQYAVSNKDKQMLELANKLKKYSTYWRDPPHQSFKGTVVKKIHQQRLKFQVISRGIDFILERDKDPGWDWRYL